MDELIDKTRTFFLGRVAAELRREIDWRAKGHGKSIPRRVAIYLAAFVRDVVRIPLHHREGIGQARFRARVTYITETAIPTLRFFRTEYPADEETAALLDEATERLEKGATLLRDGAVPALDEWYATMEEFSELTRFSREAAERIGAVIGARTNSG